MKYLIIAAIMALSLSAFGAEINIGLDRCVILNNVNDNSLPTKIGLHFTLPDTLLGKEIIYAAMEGSLSVHHAGLDSLFELYFSPLLAEWPDRAYDYSGIEAITDSMGAGNYTIRLGDSSAFAIDITGFVREVADRVRPNYGLIGTADLLGDTNIILPDAVGENLRSQVRVKVIYK
ncbi:MAG TPA: hypothetical protein DEO84_06055 [candidate division Zixibacteria bacterium]|jgi:hypothetical protein|nr:hypothetical protein [candidate division Zixibacteria bacterium]